MIRIKEWLEQGKRKNATHMIVAHDTYENSDYPVYVYEGEDVKTIEIKYECESMLNIVEVYNLNMDLERQLNEFRSFNY